MKGGVLGRLWMVFWVGRGGEEKASVVNSPIFYVTYLYIEQWGFRCIKFQRITKSHTEGLCEKNKKRNCTQLVGMFNMNVQGMDMPLHSGSSGNVGMLGLSGGGSSAKPKGIVLTMNSLVEVKVPSTSTSGTDVRCSSVDNSTTSSTH